MYEAKTFYSFYSTNFIIFAQSKDNFCKPERELEKTDDAHSREQAQNPAWKWEHET